MLTKKTIGFLGAGNLAEALISGLIASGSVSASQIIAADRISERLLHIAETYEIKVFSKNTEVASNSDIVFLTVKPNDIEAAVTECAGELTADKLVVSVAAGVTTTRLLDIMTRAGVKHHPGVIRTMPNTPATVREGMTVLVAGATADETGVNIAQAIFDSVGKVVVVDDEGLMDAVTGISGSGPAYVFLFMESLVQAGIDAGLNAGDARTLAVQTTLGAAKYAMESPADLSELRRRVTSPGGTTAEGLKALDEMDFKKALLEAVKAATRRSGELSAG